MRGGTERQKMDRGKYKERKKWKRTSERKRRGKNTAIASRRDCKQATQTAEVRGQRYHSPTARQNRRKAWWE